MLACDILSEFYSTCPLPEVVQEDCLQHRADQQQGLLLGHQPQTEAQGMDDASTQGATGTSHGYGIPWQTMCVFLKHTHEPWLLRWLCWYDKKGHSMKYVTLFVLSGPPLSCFIMLVCTPLYNYNNHYVCGIFVLICCLHFV